MILSIQCVHLDSHGLAGWSTHSSLDGFPILIYSGKKRAYVQVSILTRQKLDVQN